MPLRVFIDTSGLVALHIKDDVHHASAVSHIADMAASAAVMVTSDFVLAEFLASASRQPFRTQAVITVDQFRRSPSVQVVESSRLLWDRAFALYRARPDKEWSLVDCTTIACCTDLNIHRVLTADHHFAQAGLEALLR